ncbi:MAG: HAD-IA family hydrolase [Cyanobacteriota bacterium]|nr:HAD-IA family hydrolase [Cyanobacteriota bacterium]
MAPEDMPPEALATAAAPWPRPKGLLLDAMGTLIGLRASVGSTYAAAAARHGLSVEARRIDQLFPAVLKAAPPLAFPELRGDDLAAAELAWWGDRIDAVLQAAGAGPAPRPLQQELFELYAQPAQWRIYDDVARHLPRWRAQGLRLGIVSNFDGRLEGLLEGLGLAPLIDVVVVSSRCGAAKPSPAPFLRALESLGLAAGEVWHVGDSPEDAAGAGAAGLPCLLVRRP